MAALTSLVLFGFLSSSTPPLLLNLLFSSWTTSFLSFTFAFLFPHHTRSGRGSE